MASYLLDTNHLSPLVTLGHPLRERVLARHNSGDEFSIPVPVLTEFLYGIRLAPRAAANLQEWELLQDRFGYYTVGVVDAQEAAELQVALRRTGWQLATVDALIATIAIRNSCDLADDRRRLPPHQPARPGELDPGSAAIALAICRRAVRAPRALLWSCWTA